ncbi:MAG: DMT family transporter [Acetobacteraceae bacterium]|nr:DMT family transporter [Acetobacteraceae bacterium]
MTGAGAPPARAGGAGELAGWAAALSAVLIWAGWMVATRGTLRGHGGAIAVPDIVALRFALAGLMTLPAAGSSIRPLLRIGPKRALVGAAAGGFSFSLCNTAGLLFAPAAHGGALTPTLGAVFTSCLAALVLGERLSRLRLAGLGLILSGGVWLVGGAFAAAQPPGIFIGHLLFAGAALQWSIYTIIVRGARLGPVEALVLCSVGSAVLYLPAWLVLRGPQQLLAVPWTVLLVQALLHGALSQVISVVLFNFGVARLGAARAALCGALVPALAALGATLFLHEPPRPAELPGLAAVTIGVWLASRRTSTRAARAMPPGT